MFGQCMMVGTTESAEPDEYTWKIKIHVQRVYNDYGFYVPSGAVPFTLYGLPEDVSVSVDWGDGQTSVLTPSLYTSETDGKPSIHEYTESVYPVSPYGSVYSSTEEGNYTISMTANTYSWSQIHIV